MINNKVKYLYSKKDNFNQKLNEFLTTRNISNVDIEKIVFDIINEVKIHGDNALITMINNSFTATIPQLTILAFGGEFGLVPIKRLVYHSGEITG